MRPKWPMQYLLVFALNNKSVQWCVDTFNKRHSTTLPLEHFHTVISKSAHFRCHNVLVETCSMEWDSSWSWMYVNWRISCEDMHQKQRSHFCPPRDLDLWPCRLKVALLASPHANNLPRKFECCTVSCFQVNGWHRTDRWTDRKTVCNA